MFKLIRRYEQMSEAKFTKGEWVVTDTYSNYIYDVVRIGNFDMKVKSEANAHLIAAAPEMYEMLDEVSHVLGHELNPTNKSYIKAIKELLTKARGEKC